MKKILIITGECLDCYITQLILYTQKYKNPEAILLYDFSMLSDFNKKLADQLKLSRESYKSRNISDFDIVIFFYFIPEKGYFQSFNSKTTFYYLGNYNFGNENFPVCDMEIDLIVYHFFGKNNRMIYFLQLHFQNAQILEGENIFLPSGIDKGYKIDYKEDYKYDIIITLGGGLDFQLLDSIFQKLGNYKIVIIGSTHPHQDIQKNRKYITTWEKYSNITIFTLLDEKELTKLILQSKIVLLVFSNNLDEKITNITRISDALYLGKKVITNYIPAHDGIRHLLFCSGLDDFLYQIQKILSDNSYIICREDIQKYYLENFRMDKIIKNIL